MGSSHAQSMRRIMPQYARLDQRLTYGTIDDAFEAANAELDCGHYKNAWVLYLESLGQDLFKRWRAMPKHADAVPQKSSVHLRNLLQAKQISKWEFNLLWILISQNPGAIGLRETDTLAAIIKVFAFHNPGPVVAATPAPAPKPLPTEPEIRAERERLTAERKAFLERGDEVANPHWQAHHRALAALGLCG